MREIRQSGSEGGGGHSLPTPIDDSTRGLRLLAADLGANRAAEGAWLGMHSARSSAFVL